MTFSQLKNHRNDLIISILLILLFLTGSWLISLALPAALVVFFILFFILKKKGLEIRLTAIDLAVLAILVIELISHARSIYPDNSLAGMEKIFFWYVLYFLFRYGFSRPVLGFLIYPVITGYGVFLGLNALITLLSTDGFLRALGWTDLSGFKSFLSFFKLRINDWATLAICLLPFPLIAAVQNRTSKGFFYGALFAFCLTALAVLISFSRGAYLSLLLFGLLVLVCILISKSGPARTWLIPGLFTGSMLFLLILPFNRSVSSTLAMNKTSAQQRSTQGRLNILEDGLCKARIYWLTGTGVHNYPLSRDTCTVEQEDSGYSVFTNNLYLQILIEKGLPGLLVYGILFLLILLSFFKNLLRSFTKENRLIHGFLFSGFATYAFRELFFSSFFESSQVLVFVSLFAALASTDSPVIFSPRRHSPFFYNAAMVILVLFSAWFFKHKLNGYSAGKNVEIALAEWKKKNPSFRSSITAATKQAPSVLPYHELAGLSLIQDSLSIRKLFNGSLSVDPGALSTAKSHFLQALQLNPSDAGIHFNLGVLEFLQSHDLAGVPASHFILALQREPNNIDFLIGFGMLAEYTGNIRLADQLYQKALRLDPELTDSEFFADLKLRRPGQDSVLIEEAIATLRLRLDSSYNVIYSARLAKLFMAKADFPSASLLLEQAIRDIPTAQRPYYYLGRIAEQTGDSAVALDHFRKAFFLDKKDYLSPLALGDYYYFRMGGSRNAALSVIRNYQLALSNFLKYPSLHRRRAVAQYKTSTSITNDILFKDLIYYTRANMDFKTLASRMAEAYTALGDAEMAEYYSKAREKDLMEVELR